MERRIWINCSTICSLSATTSKICIKRLLLLSHDQASVERGFSIYKMISTVNLIPENLTSRRILKDHISSVGGVRNVNIFKKMLKIVAMSIQGGFRKEKSGNRRTGETKAGKWCVGPSTQTEEVADRRSNKLRRKDIFFGWRGQYQRFNPDVSGISCSQYQNKIYRIYNSVFIIIRKKIFL